MVPMACFCDIPLSLIKEHFDWYGRYGLGIKKRFVRSQGLKPIWYITSESRLIEGIIKRKELSHYERFHLLPYLKQYMGNQNFKGKPKRKKFYNEREWRYIPTASDVKEVFGIKQKRKLQASNSIKPGRMSIDLNEIEYIIIENTKDVEKLLITFKELTSKEVSFESLISKILTSWQIERDF